MEAAAEKNRATRGEYERAVRVDAAQPGPGIDGQHEHVEPDRAAPVRSPAPAPAEGQQGHSAATANARAMIRDLRKHGEKRRGGGAQQATGGGEADRAPAAVTPDEARQIAAVLAIRRRLAGYTEAEVEGHLRLVQMRADQYLVAPISETSAAAGERAEAGYDWVRRLVHAPRAGGGKTYVDSSVAVPPLAMWNEVRQMWGRVDVALAHHDLRGALERLREGGLVYQRCHRRVQEYIERVGRGAETVIGGLEFVVAVCGIVESVLTGGLATEAGGGLVAIAFASGGGAAGSTITFGAARIGSERAQGMEDTKWRDVLTRAGSEGVTTIVSALVGGPLTRYFVSRFPAYLGRACTEEILHGLGWTLQLGGKMPREYFVRLAQRRLAEFLGGVGAVPFTVAVEAVYSRMVGGRKLTFSQFVDEVGRQATQGALLQLFVGYLGREQGRAMESYTSLKATPEHAALAEGGAPREVIGGVGGTREVVEGGETLRTSDNNKLPPVEKARVAEATKFYKRQGIAEEKISKELNGIDLTRAVEVRRIPKGTVLLQMQIEGAGQGSYYSIEEVHPLRLGIAHKGEQRGTGSILAKKVRRWVVAEDLEGLVSTSAPAKDTWSIPGLAVQTAGGATQVYLPQRQKLTPVRTGNGHE